MSSSVNLEEVTSPVSGGPIVSFNDSTVSLCRNRYFHSREKNVIINDNHALRVIGLEVHLNGFGEPPFCGSRQLHEVHGNIRLLPSNGHTVEKQQ